MHVGEAEVQCSGDCRDKDVNAICCVVLHGVQQRLRPIGTGILVANNIISQGSCSRRIAGQSAQ